MQDINVQIQEALQTSSKMNLKIPTPRHIIIKLLKKEIFKQWKRRDLLQKRDPQKRLTADFFSETVEARRRCEDTFKVLKEKNFQPRIPYPVKLSFKNEGDIKTCLDKI